MSSSDSDYSSSDSDEGLVPVGLSNLNIGSRTSINTRNVFMGEQVVDEFGLIPAMRYDNLLRRAESFLKKGSADDKKSRKKLKLFVARKNRKTIVNVAEVAHQLNRQTGHLKAYLVKNLGVCGNVSEKGMMSLDGRFVQNQIENVLRDFIESYVACNSCGNVNMTKIIKEERLFFLFCEKCKSKRCVGNTIEGYNVKQGKQQLRGLI